MGWLFHTDRSYGRKELVAELRQADRFGDGYEMLRSQVVGNHHWYVLRRKADGRTTIGLDLLQGGGRTGGWGHKDMDETMGPCYYDCPLGYLALASEPVGYAAEWRQKVRAHHANKTDTSQLKPGSVIRYSDHDYSLTQSRGPRRGWIVSRIGGGAYRMSSRQVASATVISI